MEEKPGGELRPPSPLESVDDDLLGRAHFVKNLAEAIRRYQGGKSFSIGLHGPWGSGKSTLLNFLVAELEDAEGVQVARFNPWNFSDPNHLLASFFALLAGRLEADDPSGALKSAADYLRGISALALPLTFIGLGAVSTSAGGAAEYFEKQAAKYADIEASKKRVSEALKAAERRYVIVMDDLDRLTHEEIRQVFQIVKAGADFDNVVYLLAFDREVVARALDKVSDGDGSRYLEKVINLPINIPPLTKRQINGLVVEAVNAWAERQNEYDWEKRRVDTTLSLVPHFDTMRLINMLSNQLVWAESAVRDEVDYADFLAITMLLVLEPNVHRFIAMNESLFVDATSDRLVKSENTDVAEKKHIEEQIAQLRVRVPTDKILYVLVAVFPKVDRLFNTHAKPRSERKWVTDKRAGADFELFRRYFRLRVDEIDLSSSDLARLRATTNDQGDLARYLSSVTDLDALYRVLDALQDIADTPVSRDQIRNITGALMDVADDFQERRGLIGMLMSPESAGIFIVTALLEQVPGSMKRVQIIKRLLEGDLHSVQFPVRLIERLTSVPTDPNNTALIDEKGAAELREAVVDFIARKFEASEIRVDPTTPYIFYAWIRLERRQAFRELKRITSASDERFLWLIRRFTNVSVARSVHPLPLDLTGLAPVFSPEEIDARLGAIENSAEPHAAADASDLRILLRMAQTDPARDRDDKPEPDANE